MILIRTGTQTKIGYFVRIFTFTAKTKFRKLTMTKWEIVREGNPILPVWSILETHQCYQSHRGLVGVRVGNLGRCVDVTCPSNLPFIWKRQKSVTSSPQNNTGGLERIGLTVVREVLRYQETLTRRRSVLNLLTV